MRATLLLALVACAGLAGCTAANEDPFAYTRKPLYASTFHLAEITGEDSQTFRVEDGSIAVVRVEVWVNATSGGARVDVLDPSGRVVMSGTQSDAADLPLALGVWQVRVVPEGEAPAGTVGVLVTRG